MEDPFITRDAATEYLRERWGLELADNALRDLATKDAGPAYTIIGRRAYYKKDDLDAWVESHKKIEPAAAE